MDATEDRHAHSPRSMRVVLGITQAALASEAGISIPTLADLEAGDLSAQIATVEKVAGALTHLGFPVTASGYIAAMERERARRAGAGSAA